MDSAKFWGSNSSLPPHFSPPRRHNTSINSANACPMCTRPLRIYSKSLGIFYEGKQNTKQLLCRSKSLFCLVLMVNQLIHLHVCYRKSTGSLRRLTRVPVSKEGDMPEGCRSDKVRLTAAEPLPGSQRTCFSPVIPLGDPTSCNHAQG